MKLDGRRESTNVEDRRSGGTAAKVGGLGLGGVIIVGLLSWLFTGDPTALIQGAQEAMNSSTETTATTTEFTEEEQELATFAKQILASTEDVWTDVFTSMGKEYTSPTLVLFSGSVNSGCGNASSSTGPFYCSADQRLYVDLSFFSTMKQEFGTAGDFAYAYVIAHEVGHHVEYLLGTLQQAHAQMNRVSEKESNQISVRIELLADFYAGVWAYHENRLFGSLEDGDLQEGIDIASKIGDDYLQKQAYGYTVPESFNHGTSEQRMRWLKKGFTTGKMSDGDTFSPSYSSL